MTAPYLRHWAMRQGIADTLDAQAIAKLKTRRQLSEMVSEAVRRIDSLARLDVALAATDDAK